MDDRVVAIAVAVLVAWAGAAPAVVAQSPDPPAITVGVDAEPLDGGDTYHTPTDPLVRVQVSADAPVSLIEVRINGTTRRSFEPSSDAVDRSVFLDLETGSHRLTVVAEADGVGTYAATIIKDDVAPTVTYTAPFGPDASSDDPALPPATELTVARGNVSVDGRLDDFSLVDAVRVSHTYDYELPNGTEREGRRSHLLPTPGVDFRQSLQLVPGSNRIRVVAEDAVGNRRIHEFTVAVDDGTAPDLTVTDVEWVSPTRLHVEGRVTDRVQVQSVWLASEHTADGDVTADDGTPGRHPLVFPKSTAPDADRRSVRLDTTVYHPRGDDYVVIGTNDTAGNERTWNYSLSTFLAPNVTVADGRTGYVDDRTVAVGGRVVDGQVREVSVETVDPATGRIVDIRPVDLGPNGTFATRLGGAADETLLRVRVRDASGAEHLTNATVAAPLEPTATPAADDGGRESESDDSSGASVDPAAESGGNASDGGVRVPVVGVVVPTPDVGGVLSASVSLPVPFVGPIGIPLLAVGVPLAAVVALVVRRRVG